MEFIQHVLPKLDNPFGVIRLLGQSSERVVGRGILAGTSVGENGL